MLLRLKVLMFIDCICSTLQMLTNIENRLEDLFEQIEVMPPDRVEMAEKVTIGCFQIETSLNETL